MTGIGRALARSWWVVLPLVLGAVVLLVGLQHPGGPVHGSVLTGPTDPASPEPAAVRRVFHLEWAEDDHTLVLVVRAHRSCSRPSMTVTSTAPARLEVAIARPSDACSGRRVSWRYALPRPVVAERGQLVTVLVDGERYRAPDEPGAAF